LYSFALKRIPVLDITIIAFGFLLRAVGGALAADLPVTRWFLVCIFMASLMIASVKRRSEYIKNGDGARSVLGRYNPIILDLYVFISSASALITYCIFALSHESEYMFITIPFVLYGILRYLFVAYTDSDRTEAPDEYIFKDPHIIVTAVLFTASIVGALYFFQPAV
jgi:4-hydroxybenzoate polyprenyltransferase